MPKELATINSITGIDTRHTAPANSMRGGKNFRTRGGALMTRPGCSIVETPFSTSVVSLFQAGMPTKKTRLLAQEGTNLWQRTESSWTKIKQNLTDGKTLRGCRFIDKLILVNGSERLQYDIKNGTISSLVTGSDPIPELEYVITWKSRVWGWAPSKSNSNFIRFCGYDDDDMIDPKVWPADFTLDISRDSGSPILMAMPSINHLLVLAKNGFWQVYGDTEEDFSIQYGGAACVVSPEVCNMVGNLIFWLGEERGKKTIYVYSGTSPVPISGPIDDLLQKISLDQVTSLSFLNQYWLVANEGPKSTVFVYDVEEKTWYIYEYPFNITCGSPFAEYRETETMIVGTKDMGLLALDESPRDITEPITTEFVFELDAKSREFKSRTLHINAEPKRPFTLEIYLSADGKEEQPVKYVSFDKAEGAVFKPTKLGRIKGRTCRIRIRSTDRIEEIQEIGLVIKPRAVK